MQIFAAHSSHHQAHKLRKQKALATAHAPPDAARLSGEKEKSKFYTFGHAGWGGSQVVFYEPARGLVVVVMSNLLDMRIDKSGEPWAYEVLKLVCAQEGLGAPLPIW